MLFLFGIGCGACRPCRPEPWLPVGSEELRRRLGLVLGLGLGRDEELRRSGGLERLRPGEAFGSA